MSGSLITAPTNGDTDWSGFVSIVQKVYRQFNFVNLTNSTSTGLPEIEAGSYTSINGAMYSLAPSSGGNETITGATGISGGSELYIKATVAGSSVTCSFTTTPPTWSQAKGGYFDGDDKYIGGCYKSTGGRYQTKFVYDGKLPEDQTRPIISASVDLGVWNMDADAQKTITSALYSFTRVKKGTVMITGDTAYWRPLHYIGVNANQLGGGWVAGTSTQFTVSRYSSTSGVFNEAKYNSTTINRGEFNFNIQA